MLRAVVISLAALALSRTPAAAGPPEANASRKALSVSARTCGPHEVIVGNVCLDAYEAGVWRVPNPTTTNAALVIKIRLGRASRADLTAGGATQLGVGIDDYAPCADDGHDCADDIYAVSLPSELPSAFATWFQAQEACANAGKRLPTSAEWQIGASGTPDPGTDDGVTDCNIRGADGAATPTAERASCVSSRGAFDMVGNLAEWVAEWVPAPLVCPGWASFSDDAMCLGGASTTQTAPGALVRGGAFAGVGGSSAGPFAVVTFPPFHSTIFVGFRCVR
ncbi:MAG TPA: SUMF1/EgtB/PvdO family nonheme iron enzyme [Candidatus Polarisedimenticolaceae bacterium]|nr:SUMF1/EgtB/PvdO family nonheme iron enzyme [Candidatus Polarisedimenticolaceae bacterium]